VGFDEIVWFLDLEISRKLFIKAPKVETFKRS
jgi:hypothetical protein